MALTGKAGEMVRAWTPQTLINISMLAFLFLAMTVSWEDLYRFFFFAGVMPLTIWSFWKGEKPASAGSLVIWLLALLAIYLSINSFFVGDAEFRAISRRLRWGITVLILVGGVLIASDQWMNRPRFHGRLFLLAIIGSGLLMLIPYVLAGNFAVRISGVGLLGHTIQASSILLVLWTLGFTLLSLTPDLRYRDMALLSLSLGIVLSVIVLSQSRGPLLAGGGAVLLAGMACILLLSGRRRAITLGIMGILGVSAAVCLFARRSMVLEYLDSLIARGSSYRLEIWKAVIEQSSSSWMFGVGTATRLSESAAGEMLFLQTGVYFTHTHNLFIEVYYAGGIVAVALLIAVLGVLFRKLIAMPVPGGTKMACICLLMVMLMVNVTDTVSPISSPKPDWVLFWLPLLFLAAVSWRYQDSEETVKSGPGPN